MKKTNNFAIIFLLLISITINNSQSQSIQTIDQNSLEKPFISTKGKTLYIICDSVVLISPYRFRLYEKARLAILSTDFVKYNELFDAYDTQFRFYKAWNDSLQLKYTDINTLFKKSLENTQNSLTSINNNLSAAKDSLGNANNNLNEALFHLKAAKREKWYFASVGFLIGSLMTIIFVAK